MSRKCFAANDKVLAVQKKYGIAVHDLHVIVDAAKGDLSHLRCAHIFLTGCTGFLGKWIVEALLYADEALSLQMQVTVLTRSAQRVFVEMPHWRKHNSLHLVEGDVSSWDSERVQGITHIIHGANYTNAGQEGWALEHMTTAYEGTRRMLEVAREQQCQALLLLSSGAVYGFCQKANVAPFVEQERCADDYLQEPHVYALCKYFEETYTAAYGKKYGIRIPIARLFTFIGKYMPLHKRQALSSFINDVQNDRDIVVQGDGTAVRTYMYAADMVVWLLALLVRGEHGTPYNVGSDEPMSIRDLAAKVVEASGKDRGIHILGEAAEGNAPNEYVPSMKKSKALVNNCNHVKFFQAVKKMFFSINI